VATSDFIDNLYEDVYYASTSYDWGLAASFTCDTSSCY